MEKLVYLCWKKNGDPIARFRDALLNGASQRILSSGAHSLTVNVADWDDERVSASPLVIGEGRTLSASVSLWIDSIDARRPIEEALGGLSSKLHGYLVTESVPLRYADRQWADGTKSPGVTLFTAFAKPDRLTDDQFYGHWHGSHTPLTFEIHPIWRYIRNAVARPLTAAALPYRGIVEERFREIEDVLDMERLFRGAAANMKRGMKDVAQFLDRDKIDATLMNEYIVKSERG
ncbi:MAG: EthD domain-containing protein [Polyangiaceae bacterium]